MLQIKKTILTLVALLAVTTGAWAQEETLLTTILSTGDNASFKSGSKTFDDIATVTFSNEVWNDNDNWGWYFSSERTITVTAATGYNITRVKFFTKSGSAFDEEAPFEAVITNNGKNIAIVNGTSIGEIGVTKIEVYGYVTPAASGPAVDWNKAAKTGTFTMPGGNVELEPEYYPQATMVAGAVTAVAGVKATTDDPLVTLDKTKLIGASGMMYYVGTTDTKPAYNAEGWTSEVPTATDITMAKTVYVWYYPVGADSDNPAKTYSDGEMNINALQVAVADPPTYAVTFAEGTPEADKWATNIPDGGVVKGTPVTVTYSGTKKVLGVKAEKKASTVPVTAITLNKTATTIYKLNDNSTETLSVTAVTPDEATDKTYTWSSDDITKATVDQNGVVTAVAEGTAHIRATANDGSGVYGECTVTVSDLSAYYSNMVECGCGNLDGKCANGANPMSPFTGQVLSAAQAIALAKAKAAETSSNCAVFYDNGSLGEIKFAKNDGTTGSAPFYYDVSDKGLSGYKGYYVSK